MALSRIWAAFILVAIGVAGIKYVFSPNNKDIFSSMVTGKAGDTLRFATPAPVPSTPTLPVSTQGSVPGAYTVQHAAGIIETRTTPTTLIIAPAALMPP